MSRSPFAEITAFEPQEHSGLQEELIPLKYACYRAPTLCANCGTRQTESRIFLVLGHTRRVDVAKMTVVNKFTMNLPIEVRDLALRELPACFMCFDTSALDGRSGLAPPDLSDLPAPAEAPAWADAVQRAKLREERSQTAIAAAFARAQPKRPPSIEDL